MVLPGEMTRLAGERFCQAGEGDDVGRFDQWLMAHVRDRLFQQRKLVEGKR